MKHSKYMNLCYCAAGRAEPRGAKRAQLKHVDVAEEIVRSAKQLLRNVCSGRRSDYNKRNCRCG